MKNKDKHKAKVCLAFLSNFPCTFSKLFLPRSNMNRYVSEFSCGPDRVLPPASRTGMRLPRPELTRGARSRKLGERSRGNPKLTTPSNSATAPYPGGSPGPGTRRAAGKTAVRGSPRRGPGGSLCPFRGSDSSLHVPRPPQAPRGPRAPPTPE